MSIPILTQKEKIILLSNSSEEIKSNIINKTNRVCTKKCELESDEAEYFYKKFIENQEKNKKTEQKQENYFLNKMSEGFKNKNSEIYRKTGLNCFDLCVSKRLKGYMLSKDEFRNKEIEILNIDIDNSFLYFFPHQ